MAPLHREAADTGSTARVWESGCNQHCKDLLWKRDMTATTCGLLAAPVEAQVYNLALLLPL